MADYPRRRIVLDSVGKPVEETSAEGLEAAVARHLAENPMPSGGISDQQIAAAVAAYFAANPPQGGSISEANIALAVNAYISANPPQAGDRGPVGDKGPTGDRGAAGLPGAIGDKGPTGDKGAVGNAGSPGLAGDKGPVGDKGPAGDKGIAGDKGATGDAGSKGPTGDQGLKGAVGDQGPTGNAGATGNPGPTGDKGSVGDAGSKGPTGDKGATGDKGPTGDAGPAGSDGWTRLKLAQDFTTSSATAVDITGLAFTPAAGKTYEFEAQLNCRTATATVGPRPGVAWPTGLADGTSGIRIPSAAATEVAQFGNIAAPVLAPVGGLPTTTGSYGALIEGNLTAGATPSGTLRLQLASETAGTVVTVKAGSFLRYREVA